MGPRSSASSADMKCCKKGDADNADTRDAGQKVAAGPVKAEPVQWGIELAKKWRKQQERYR